jgi:gluconate 5-dehydrogenase
MREYSGMQESQMHNNIFSLIGKTIVVTGGAGYLGASLVQGLLTQGASVVASVDVNKLQSSLLREDGTGFFEYACDLSETQSIKAVFEKIYHDHGRIDALVNCAVYGPGYGPDDTKFESITDTIFREGVDGSLGTVFRATREILPFISDTDGGSIINIASMYGVVSPDPSIYGISGQNNPPAYGAGKAGVIQLTRYCAAHLAERNIRVNCIIPGPFPRVDTVKDQEFLEQLKSKTMLGRVGEPKEIIGPVALLCSSASSFMTGSAITVDGGWTAW